jgi:hypothetical protein
MSIPPHRKLDWTELLSLSTAEAARAQAQAWHLSSRLLQGPQRHSAAQKCSTRWKPHLRN